MEDLRIQYKQETGKELMTSTLYYHGAFFTKDYVEWLESKKTTEFDIEIIQGQADAWNEVYKVCRELGMQLEGNTGLGMVLNFIKESVKRRRVVLEEYDKLAKELKEVKAERDGLKEGVIVLNKAEIQSGHDRQKWAEGLLLKYLNDVHGTHEGVLSWLLNYGKGECAKKIRANKNIGFDEKTQSAELVSSPPKIQEPKPEQPKENLCKYCKKPIKKNGDGWHHIEHKDWLDCSRLEAKAEPEPEPIDELEVLRRTVILQSETIERLETRISKLEKE